MTNPQQPTREVLEQALERMDRARDILTNGNPRPECNWGLLDTAELRQALAQPAPSTIGEADSSVTIHIDQYDKLECCRRLLEIIATGDSDDPRKDAEDELVAHGFWNPTHPQASEPAPSTANDCKLTECQGLPRCQRCVVSAPSTAGERAELAGKMIAAADWQQKGIHPKGPLYGSKDMRHAAALLQSPALPDAGKRDTPFTNCRFQICDLPGQCKGEGKCHHPAVPAALPASDTPKIGCVQHDCAECQARAALPVGELTDRQILDIAKIDCRIEFSNDDIEEDAQIETTITFARAILAAAQTAPALVPLTSEHHFAIRQGHQIAAEDEYFAARPQIDNNDRRKVYEAGFNRGFDIAHGIT
jgi:hypothetical protein